MKENKKNGLFLNILHNFSIVRIKNPGLAMYCYNFLFTFTLFKTKAKHRFAHFLITLSNSPLGIGVIYNHMIKKWAKQTNFNTQVQVFNNRKKQKATRPGFSIWTMVTHGYMDIWSHRYTVTKVHGYTDTWLTVTGGTQIHGYTDTVLHNYMVTKV